MRSDLISGGDPINDCSWYEFTSALGNVATVVNNRDYLPPHNCEKLQQISQDVSGIMPDLDSYEHLRLLCLSEGSLANSVSMEECHGSCVMSWSRGQGGLTGLARLHTSQGETI